jgi:glutamate--cysteine ligase catalytic subunit
MRFKPPPSKDSKIGWRVEFRTMDIQLTDFENAALIVLLGMIVNIINNFDVDFVMPISKIDENIARAHKVDGLLKEKFWFKTNIVPSEGSYRKADLKENDYLRSHNLSSDTESSSSHDSAEIQQSDSFHELYVHEILTGKPEIGFKGIYPLIEEFMADKGYKKDEVCQVRTYMQFLLERATGEVKTGARYIRDFVFNHPEYKQDSVVGNKIAYDLMSSIVNMSKCPEERAKLLGKKWQNQ